MRFGNGLGLGAILLLFYVPTLGAQQCTPPAHPYFDFQVDQPATFVPDSTVSPRPDARRIPRKTDTRPIVQFTVDSLGVPDTASYRVLRLSDDDLAGRGRLVLSRWRFTSARVRGCRVPQLVQTALVP